MATARKPAQSHGRSEIWSNKTLARAVEKELARLGERCRALRIERELSQEQAAEKAHLHANHIRRIENARGNPTVATMVALARAYKVSLAELFGEEELI